MMKRKWYFYFDQKGFSLAEILITLVIISILAVIGIPHYLKSQRKGMQNEAKILLMELYTKERAFVGEWGFGTPNFHQLGYFPRGNYFYNAGWSKQSSENMKNSTTDINRLYDNTIHKRQANGDPNPSDPISGYAGYYLPSNLSNTLYDGSLDLKIITNVEELCKDSGVFKKDEAPCMFNPSAVSNPRFDITAKLGTHDINIDNGSDPTKAPLKGVKFKIGARGYFEGAPNSDEWVIDESGRLKNVQIGL